MRWGARNDIEQVTFLYRIECEVIVMYFIGVMDERDKD